MVDWNATQETLTQSYAHVNLLKNIFEKWDPGIKHSKIKILNGGYQEWLARYPAFTTNPNIQIPELNNVENEILETLKGDFEYPDWVYSDEEDEILKGERIRKSKLNNKNIDVEMDHGDNKSATSRYTKLNSSDTVSSNKSKNFVTHVTISIDDKRPSRSDSANGQHLESPESPVLTSQPKISNKVSHNEVSVKPVIDRSSKPTTLKTCDPRCKEILRFMKELNELAKSKSKLANELLCQEYELYTQREDKYSASDEKYLRAEIKSLKVKLEDMVFIYIFLIICFNLLTVTQHARANHDKFDIKFLSFVLQHKMYLKIENEFKAYSDEAGTIKFNDSEDNEKKNLSLILSLLKNEIKDIETKRKKLQE